MPKPQQKKKILQSLYIIIKSHVNVMVLYFRIS